MITENQERADAFLRGAAEDLVFTDVHSSSEGINARSNFGTSRYARGYDRIGNSETAMAESASERTKAAASKSGGTKQLRPSGW